MNRFITVLEHINNKKNALSNNQMSTMNMLLLRNIIIFFSILLLSPLSLRADVIFSNYGPGNSVCGTSCSWWDTGLHSPEQPYHRGMPFTVQPGTSFKLDSINVTAFDAQGFEPATYIVSVNADSGGLPGAVLEQFTFNLNGSNLFNPLTWVLLTGTSVVHPTFFAGTQYWLTTDVSNPATMRAGWPFNNQGSTGTPAWHAGSAPWTLPWGNVPQTLGAFRIMGTPITAPPPEELSYSIAPQSTKVREGDGSITFTITRLDTTKAETLYASTVALVKNDGDYSGMDGQPILNKPLSFAVGDKLSTVQVKIINENVIEYNETFQLIVQRSTSDKKSVFLASAMFTILDDDAPTLEEVNNDAIFAAKGLIGAPYLGDAFTYSGKGYDCEVNQYTEATEIKDKNVGYNYYDSRIKECNSTKGAGVDCSGLVMWSFNRSYAPKPYLSIISNESADSIKELNTEPVPDGSKQPGDLMFFLYEGSVKHVAMYVGDFSYNNGKTVDTYDVVESTLTKGVIPSKSSELKAKSTFVGYGRITEPKVEVAIRTASPIDLIVTDPDGFTITPDTIEWNGEEWIHEIPHQLYYSIYDFEEDGSPKTQVYSPHFKLGNYEIRPVKRKNAPPNAVYSISMTTDAGAMLIAENVPVDSIPPTGYGVTVKETGLTQFIPINQFPTANAGPDQTVECTSQSGANVNLDGSRSSDPDNDPLIYKWTGLFGERNGVAPTVPCAIGKSTIKLTVEDGKGGIAIDTIDVTVVDTTPPTITSVQASKTTLWPPNHKMMPVTVKVSANDLCSAATCTIVGVQSNEPVNGTGDGDMAPDWKITGPLTVNLRAERAGNGTGRMYTLTVKCIDAAGNGATKNLTVSVPHNQ